MCKVVKGHEFRFRTKPGRYCLRLGVSPYDDARVTIKGAAGGDKVLPAAKGENVVEAMLEATDTVMSISIDNYATLRWLTVVQRLPGE